MSVSGVCPVHVARAAAETVAAPAVVVKVMVQAATAEAAMVMVVVVTERLGWMGRSSHTRCRKMPRYRRDGLLYSCTCSTAVWVVGSEPHANV